jgi:hypothetical protein
MKNELEKSYGEAHIVETKSSSVTDRNARVGSKHQNNSKTNGTISNQVGSKINEIEGNGNIDTKDAPKENSEKITVKSSNLPNSNHKFKSDIRIYANTIETIKNYSGSERDEVEKRVSNALEKNYIANIEKNQPIFKILSKQSVANQKDDAFSDNDQKKIQVEANDLEEKEKTKPSQSINKIANIGTNDGKMSTAKSKNNIEKGVKEKQPTANTGWIVKFKRN